MAYNKKTFLCKFKQFLNLNRVKIVFLQYIIRI